MSNKVYFRFIPSSLDGLFNPEIKNAHVPKWNYVLLRFQVFFLVYSTDTNVIIQGFIFLRVPPSRVSRFPRSPRACLHSSEKCEIIVPVLQPISSPAKMSLAENPFYSEKNQRLNLSL